MAINSLDADPDAASQAVRQPDVDAHRRGDVTSERVHRLHRPDAELLRDVDWCSLRVAGWGHLGDLAPALGHETSASRDGRATS